MLGPDRFLFGKEDCLPADLRESLLASGPQPAWCGALLAPDAEVVSVAGPCLAPFHPGLAFPRMLLDMLPPLFLRGVLADLGRPFPIAMSRAVPDWMRRVVGLYAGEQDIIWYDPARQVVRAPMFIVPAIMQYEGFVHPAINLAVADWMRRAGSATAPAGGGQKLYLSYHAFGDGHLSRLDNEPELAAILQEMGFRTLQPWRMTLAEQLAAYRDATCIVSEQSAAACNALFARPGCRVGTIGAAGTTLEQVCALRGHLLGTIAPDAGIPHDPAVKYRVDPERFRAFLAQIIADAPMPPEAKNAHARSTSAEPTSGVMELLAGPALSDLSGDPGTQSSIVLPGEDRQRRTPFHAMPIDAALAPYGRLFTDPEYRMYHAPEIRLVGLDAASAIGATGLVCRHGRLVRDTMYSVDDWRPESVIAKRDLERGISFKRPIGLPGRRLDRPAFAVTSGGWRNHAHWLTEILPRLCIFRRLADSISDLHLLAPDFGASPVHARTLELLGISPERTLRLAEADVVTPTTLLMASGIDLFSVSRICRMAAEELAAAAGADTADSQEDNAADARIYIHRARGVRRLANFDAVAPVLDAFGFRVVAMEDLTLDEQIRMMRRARHVVGEHGAGIANVMFCRTGARVLEMFNPVCAQPAHWSLASVCDLDFGYIVGSHVPTPFRPEPDWNADYSVSPDDLSRALEAMLG